ERARDAARRGLWRRRCPSIRALHRLGALCAPACPHCGDDEDAERSEVLCGKHWAGSRTLHETIAPPEEVPMTARLSQPIESLIDNAHPETVFAEVDVAIVGSGYGGSIAAARLAGPHRRVVILERGREYAPGDFPVDLGH